MKSLGTVDLGIDGWISFLSWDDGYVFAVVDGESDRAVVTIDPVGRLVQARHPVNGTILQVRRGVDQQVVLLLAPRHGIGPLRFGVVGGKGMTTTPIPGFTGGWGTDQDGDVVRARQKIPALIVDEVGERALVVSGRAVAEISLNNLAVSRHTLSEPVSLLGRLRNWLEPPAEAKLVDGPWRNGTWIGDGLLAISGEDYSSEGGQHHHAEPAGISIVDTRDWSVQTIDDNSVEVVATEHALVGHGGYELGGVTGYDAGGDKLFELLPNTSVWLQVVGGYVYAVHENSKTFTVIDPSLGRVVGKATTKEPLTLVEG